MRLFRRTNEPTPDLATSGHTGDDMLLAQIASSSDLDAPRHLAHYLYFPDEARARSAAEVVRSAAWDLQRVDVSASGGPDWVVIAERHGR